MFVDISLNCVVSQRPLCGTLVRVWPPLSLMIPYSQRVMKVLRHCLYDVVSDGHVLGFFDSLQAALLIGFPQEANIFLDAAIG